MKFIELYSYNNEFGKLFLIYRAETPHFNGLKLVPYYFSIRRYRQLKS